MTLPEPDTYPDLPRVLALHGATNVRDIGGWPVRGGGTVRFGQVFRSASLANLTEADAQALAGTGLRSVCDLRGEAERRRAPSRLGAIAGLSVHTLSIDPSLGASLKDMMTQAVRGEDVLGLLRRAYVAYAMDWSHVYQRLFALLADPARRPLLFHCSAGKDRTGFGAALLLTALGVPEEAVRADYVATNRLWRAESELVDMLPPEAAAVLLRAHPELLDGAFDAIRAAFGSIEAYLEHRIGLPHQALLRLREEMVD